MLRYLLIFKGRNISKKNPLTGHYWTCSSIISGKQSMHLPFITVFAIFLVLKSDAYSLCKNIIVMQSQPMDMVLLS